MPNPTVTKTCSSCKEEKPLSEFNLCRSTKDGRHNRCTLCHRKADKRYRDSKKGTLQKATYRASPKGRAMVKASGTRYAQTDSFKADQRKYKQSDKGKASGKRRAATQRRIRPNHIAARLAVSHAIEQGKLPPAKECPCNCDYCNKQASQYHHWLGYAREHWLHVIPLCLDCHGAYDSISS